MTIVVAISETPKQSVSPIDRIVRVLAGPAIVVLVGAFMLWWSWGTWPDVLVDIGRELYVPWRLSEGEVLYRDIVSYFNGPLSPYLHALLFKMFGVSLRTLVVFNLFVIALLATLLYSLIRQTAGRTAAAAGTITFFVLFAFAQYLLGGNFNYVTPYSYELSHGITLAAAAIWCLERWNRTARRRWLIVAGLLLGVVLLTKAEVMLAAGAGFAAAFVAVQWNRRASIRALAIDLATAFVSAIVPILIAISLLTLVLPPADAIRGMLGAWHWVGDSRLLELPYFKELAGTDDVSRSVLRMLTWTIGYGVLFGAGALVASTRRNIAAIVFMVLLIAGLALRGQIEWFGFVRPTPVLLAVAAGAIVYRGVRDRSADLVLPFTLIVWALAMLAKMPLYPHIYHYGFALAMPATIVSVTLLTGWLPNLLDDRGWNGNVLRATVAAALVVTFFVHLERMSGFWKHKTITVGAGGDQFIADERANYVNAILALLAQTPKDATVVVVPEGLTMNYFARRVNPTGQLNFTPPAIIMYGEETILRAFQEHPPDYLVITGVDTREYGPRFFGADYARNVGAWMSRNYVGVAVVGQRPNTGPRFGIALLKRAAPTTAPTQLTTQPAP